MGRRILQWFVHFLVNNIFILLTMHLFSPLYPPAVLYFLLPSLCPPCLLRPLSTLRILLTSYYVLLSYYAPVRYLSNPTDASNPLRCIHRLVCLSGLHELGASNRNGCIHRVVEHRQGCIQSTEVARRVDGDPERQDGDTARGHAHAI